MSESAKRDVVEIARKLAPVFAETAASSDANDSFVTENYAVMKSEKLFSAGVAADLGGGGATHRELCAMLRELARGCSSTALALSMHTHLVATAMFRRSRGDTAVEGLLRKVADQQLVLVSTGASDWLEGSGTAEKVDGGFRITGKKIFGSGSPAGDLLLTTAVYDDPQNGPTVLHLPIALKQAGVRVEDNWRTLGMRATGSNDISIEGVFVPDAAIAVRRPRGKWHGAYDVIVVVAMPLIMSAYLGVAETARKRAMNAAQKRRDDPLVQVAAGELDTALATATLAVDAMVAEANNYDFTPNIERTSSVLTYKSIAARALSTLAERTMEVAGGASFFRGTGIERLFRDLQGARFHPLPEKKQQLFSGRVALGLDPV